MLAQYSQAKFLFSIPLLQHFVLRAIPVAPLLCVVNTFAQHQLGEKVMLGMIVFSSILDPNYLECGGSTLLVRSYSFRSLIGTHIIHVSSSNGSQSLVTSQMMRRASGWWSLTFAKMDNPVWQSYISTPFIVPHI